MKPLSVLFVTLGRMQGLWGVLPYVCILGMCRARDPHFSPKFPFRSVSSLQKLMFKYFAQEHSSFYSFCRSVDHNVRNFAAHGRLTRSGAPHFHARATRARSGTSHLSLCRGAPGLAAGQNARQRRPTVRSGEGVYKVWKLYKSRVTKY